MLTDTKFVSVSFFYFFLNLSKKFLGLFLNIFNQKFSFMFRVIKKYFQLLRDFPFILYAIVNFLKEIRDIKVQERKEKVEKNGKEESYE